MSYQYEFAGVSVPTLTQKFDEVFEETYDEETWVTRKTYHQVDPPLSFKYKYVLKTVEVEDPDDSGEPATLVTLEMTLLPESLCKAKREELANDCGCEEKDLTVTDVAHYFFCGCIPFGDKLVKCGCDDEGVDAIKDTVASILSSVDMLRGFMLNRCMNKLGTTGWDLVKEAKGRIKCAIRHSLRQAKREWKNHKENN